MPNSNDEWSTVGTGSNLAVSVSNSSNQWTTVGSGIDIEDVKPGDKGFEYNAENLGKAYDGLNISLGVTPLPEDNQDKTSQVITNGDRVRAPFRETGEAVVNTAVGFGKGVNDILAQLTDLVGADKATKFLKENSDYYADKIPENSAGAAIGQELGSMAVTAPAGTVAGKLLGAAVKAVPKAARKAIYKSGRKEDLLQSNTSGQLFAKSVKKANEGKMTSEALKKSANTIEEASQAVTAPPSVNAISDVIGKLSPSTKKLVDEYYNLLITPIITKARAEAYSKARRELVDSGFSIDETEAILRTGNNLKSMIKEGTNRARTATNPKPISKGTMAGVLLGQNNY